MKINLGILVLLIEFLILLFGIFIGNFIRPEDTTFFLLVFIFTNSILIMYNQKRIIELVD